MEKGTVFVCVKRIRRIQCCFLQGKRERETERDREREREKKTH